MHWREMKVWQKAHDVALEVYKESGRFPQSELYGVTSQLRRASTSVPANIVEGSSRKSIKEYLQFLYNARGSLEETRYFLLLAKDLGYLESDAHAKVESQCEEVSRMLNALIKSIKREVL